MNNLRLVMVVAAWEFGRFFRLKDQCYGLLLVAICCAAGYGSAWLVEKSGGKVRLAVVGDARLPLEMGEDSRIILEKSEASELAALREKVARRDLEGVLVVDDVDQTQLFVWKEPLWETELKQALTAARQLFLLAQSDVPAADVDRILGQIAIDVTYVDEANAPTTTAEKVVAGSLIFLTLYGVGTGMALFLVGVTAEKQQRVTEQIITAISPQTWMDGKLVGLTLFSLVGVVSASVTGLLGFLGWRYFAQSSIEVPQLILDPWLIGAFVALALLGIVFWNCFIAVVAATIDDPNTSARNVFVAVPVIPVGLAYLVLVVPDSTALQMMGVLPGFSSAILPARMVLTDVAAWEFPVALTLLLIGIAMMRRAAGKVMAVSMLIYGKEPTFREMWKWIVSA